MKLVVQSNKYSGPIISTRKERSFFKPMYYFNDYLVLSEALVNDLKI